MHSREKQTQRKKERKTEMDRIDLVVVVVAEDVGAVVMEEGVGAGSG